MATEKILVVAAVGARFPFLPFFTESRNPFELHPPGPYLPEQDWRVPVHAVGDSRGFYYPGFHARLHLLRRHQRCTKAFQEVEYGHLLRFLHTITPV